MATAEGTSPTKLKRPDLEDMRREGIVKALTKALITADHFAIDESYSLYRYQDECYRLGGEHYIGRALIRLCNDWKVSRLWSTRLEHEILSQIIRTVPSLWTERPSDRINVRNGILSLTSPIKLLPHSPKFLSNIQIAVSYNPKATCPAWERQIRETLPEDCQNLVWQILAWLILPEAKIQQAILFLGGGANGKSRLLQAIRAFLGESNVTSFSLHQLEKDRFSTALLVGMLANICSDLPSEHLASTAMFKAILSEDTIQAQHKFRPSFSLTPHCKLLFSANSFPQSSDTSYGFLRRIVPVPFDKQFIETAIPSFIIDKRLAKPSEVSGALNKALEVLPGLRQRTSFEQSPSMKATWSQFYDSSYSVDRETEKLALWLDRYTLIDPESKVSKADLYDTWKAWAQRTGTGTESPQWFGRRLRELRPSLQPVQITAQHIWAWQGISLRSQNGLPTRRPQSQKPPIY